MTEYRIGDIIVRDSFTGNSIYVIVDITYSSNKGTYYLLKDTETSFTIKVNHIEMPMMGVRLLGSI